MRFAYTAHSRAIIAPGHQVNDPYEFIIGGRAFTMSMRRKQDTKTSLDGTSRTQLFYVKRRWNITTTLIPEGQRLLEWEEFIDSVSAGETFVWDRGSSTAAVDVSPLNVKLVSNNHQQRRIMRTPNYRFTLQVEQV